MARQISKHSLNCSTDTQVVSLQRRARILCVAPGDRGPDLFAETDVDDTTRAIDVKHSREFVVLMAGASAPSGSCYIGSTHVEVGRKHAVYHVYELPGVKPIGL